MKIAKIVSKDVRGMMNGTYELPYPVTIITGPNGTGKTTFLDLIKNVLTGEKMANGFVRKGAKKGEYEMTFGNGDVLTMTKTATEGSSLSTKLNGKSTTLAKLREYINTADYIDSEIIKYSDVLDNMKPKELADFIMKYVPETISRDNLISYLPKYYESQNPGEETSKIYDGNELAYAAEYIAGLFPDTFERDKIKEIYESAKSSLSNEKKAVASAQYQIRAFQEKQLPSVGNYEELQKKAMEYNAIVQNVNVITELWNKYNQQVTIVNNYNQQINTLQSQVNAMAAVTEPDMNAFNQMQDALKQWKDYRTSIISQISSLESSKKMFNDALQKLDTSVCPLSQNLVCTVDKTPVKNDLITNINSLSSEIEISKGRITEADEKITAMEQWNEQFSQAQNAWNQKNLLINQLNQMIVNRPTEPVKPEQEIPNMETVNQEIATLNGQIAIAMEWMKYENTIKECADHMRTYHLFNYIVKALDDKGDVMKSIMEKYTSTISSLISSKVKAAFPDWEITFTFNNGLVPVAKIGNAEGVEYPALSTGEQAIVALFLTDMLNSVSSKVVQTANGTQSSGLRTMLIDGLEKLDAENFRRFISTVLNPAIIAGYDNVIINAVYHDDICNMLNSFGQVNLIEMKKN